MTIAALFAAGCASAAQAGGPRARPANAIRGGTVTLANLAGAGADWIFPLAPLPYYSEANYQDFMDLVYRPLYLFGGNSGTSVSVNYPLSPARAPVYSDGGRTVTITLKGWKWSDGETVDASDVIFWLNLDEAERANFAGYTPGTLPDNLASYQATSPDHVTLHLSKAYASTWFTYNQLAEITPFPMSWDVTRSGAQAGSGGCLTDTAADHWTRCKAVYAYLVTQAKDTASFASPDSVWAVSDGPWKLKAFNINGNYSFVPNTRYSGIPRPALSELRFKAYDSEAAVYAAMKAGQVSTATVPAQDLPAKPAGQVLPTVNPLAGAGDRLQPAYQFGIGYAYENWRNSMFGPLVRQLYFRQALQELVDQPAMIRAGFGGYAYPTSGAVPARPASQWSSAGTTAGRYAYDPAEAEAELAAHGWRKVHGVLTCEKPGTGAGQCGAGIAGGLRAKFTIAYDGPSEAEGPAALILRSDMGSAGIQLTPVWSETLLGIVEPCKGRYCWALLDVGGWIYNGPGFEPTGEPLFQSGADSNIGGYSDPVMDSLISRVQASNSSSAFRAYASYTASQLPVLYLPWGYNIVAVSDKLHDVTQSPLGTFLPEYWYLTR